jgi:hypothetical protein
LRVITVARKPPEGPIAANIQRWGSGGLAVDPCRISSPGGSPAAARRASARKSDKAPMAERIYGSSRASETELLGKLGRRGSADVYMAERPSEQLGRWPANVILQHVKACDGECGPVCPVGILDRQSESGGTGTGVSRRARPGQQPFKVDRGKAPVLPRHRVFVPPEDYGDSGTAAARFFKQVRP